MEQKKTERKSQKSTVLLILFLFFLFTAAHMFRTSISTLCFTEDTSSDYASVEATLNTLKSEIIVIKSGIKEERITPVFSIQYDGKNMLMEAPDLAFDRQKRPPFLAGNQYRLWIHKRRGNLIIPPVMGVKELGRSQLKISMVFLLIAGGLWYLRNTLSRIKQV